MATGSASRAGRSGRAWAAVVLASACAQLAGCASGHGKHTGKFLEERQEKMAQMRAATEWDQAERAFFAGDLPKALHHVDQSLALNDSVPKSHVLRGRILMEMGSFDSAIDSFQQAEALQPDNVDAQYFLGLTYERTAQKAEALARYQRAAELDPANPQYAVAAAEMLIDLDRPEEAEQFLLSRSDRLEHSAGVRQTLGHIAAMRGDADRAVALFTEAQLLAPADAGIREDLARAQMAAGQFAEAEYTLSRLLAEPDTSSRRDLKFMRAQCLMAVDRPVEARSLLIELTSDAAGQADVRAWVELGKVAYELRDMNRVRLAAGRLIALAPERSEGYVLRALWQRHRGDLTSALSSLNAAVERRGADTAPLVLRAMVQRDLGQLEAARQSAAIALSERPGDVQIRRLLDLIEASRATARAEVAGTGP